MLWVLVFVLPAVKMALLAAFFLWVWRHDRDPGEEVEVAVGVGPDRPRAPGPRPRRGPLRGGPGRRALRRARARAAARR